MQIAWEMIHCLWIFIKIEQMKVLRVWKGEKDVISKRKDVDKENRFHNLVRDCPGYHNF